MYHARHLEQKIKSLSKQFKIILITGARQVGKSTLLAHLFPTLKQIVFDPVQDLYRAKEDPDLFLSNFQPPIVLDEIQYAKELLPSIKRYVDASDKCGLYFLTGSQNLNVLKHVAESLAGRVGILHLEGFSLYEMANAVKSDEDSRLFPQWLSDYLSHPSDLPVNFSGIFQNIPPLFESLWRGGMPGITDMPNENLNTYFSSYIGTYIERDVRLIENVSDLSTFNRFVILMAALTAQEINFSEIGRELGISRSTAERWLAVLIHSYQWREIWPFHGNLIKRVSKRSKGYFTDAGIACYLNRISSPIHLAEHPLRGALFETFCVSNISKLMSTLPFEPQLYHWRSSGGAEVDLILEQDNQLFPIEIKCKTQLSKHDARGIHAFKETYPHRKIMPGLIIYAGTECYSIAQDVIAFPWNGKTQK